MSNPIFDFDDGDYIMRLSDDTAIDTDGNMMMRMSDNTAMDMDTGDFHFISSWPNDDN